MALINRAGQEVSAKVVYYGPGLSGKTTNLEVLFRQVPEDHRGKMISMKTRTDRTLFFDLLPLSGDAILDFNVRILLYTVPGQVYYNATRRLVLKGVDAVVFVADSQRGKMEENLESLENLRSNLADMNLKLEDLPWVIQYNKRDLPDVLSVQELEHALNPTGVPCFSAVAPRGEGVQETLRGITEHLRPQLRALVEKEIGESLRSAPPESLSRSTLPLSGQPPRVEAPAPRQPEPAAPRCGLNLDQLPDPRVVEIAPGELHDKALRSQSPLVDLMEGADVRYALRDVETSIETSPLRSLADALPSRGGERAPAGAAQDRWTAAPPSRPVARVVPEIVELEPAAAAAPPAPSVPAPPSAGERPSFAPLILRVPRALLERGELEIRLVVEETPAPAPAATAGGGQTEAKLARSSAPVAGERSADLKPRLSAECEFSAVLAETPVAVPVTETLSTATAAPGRASGAWRPAGAGMRFALRNGELVPLD